MWCRWTCSSANPKEADETPLLMLDIAMPRDIEPCAGALPGVRLFNIDDLRMVVAENLDQWQAEGEAAQAMIEAEVDDFMAWFQALAVTPLISDLRQQAELIRQRELERALHRLEGLPENYVNIVDLLTRRIINQILHQPTVRLKERAACADGKLYAEALRDLFGLGDAPGLEHEPSARSGDLRSPFFGESLPPAGTAGLDLRTWHERLSWAAGPAP